MRVQEAMDPLGVVADVPVESAKLKTWAEAEHGPTEGLDHATLRGDRRTPHALHDYDGGEAHRMRGSRDHSSAPFHCRPDLNMKVALWSGDISALKVDAIVNPTNESMNERNPISDRIMARAGPGLQEEIIRDVKVCRTGEVVVTQGHNLPARYILHTVGPKYNIKYQTAAENSLHLCYRNVLQKVQELQLTSVALCVINSVQRNYPPEDGAHISLRTTRRFLEQWSGALLSTVVFVLDPLDLGIYRLLMPLYFPRNPIEEENGRRYLPLDIGGPDGEPQIPDRQIRIIDNPQNSHNSDGCDESVDLSSWSSSQFDVSLNVGEHAFSQMQGDLDQQRLLGGSHGQGDPLGDIMLKEMQNKERSVLQHDRYPMARIPY